MEFVEIKHEDLPNTKFILQSSAIEMWTMQHDIVNIDKVTEAEYKSKFLVTKDTSYLALMGELWNVYCEDVG